jgi:hypothetical protein
MAQRVSAVAPFGSLLKGNPREKKTKAAPKKSARTRDNAHIDAIQQLPCINPQCRRDPAGVAAHVRFACFEAGKPITGGQVKPDDWWTLPLCPTCHTDGPDAQHKGAEEAFYQRIKVDPLQACKALYDASPNVEHMRATVFLFHTNAMLEG